MAKGDLAEACKAFQQSQKLEPAVTTLMNLASCREKAGQFASAWGIFLEVERQTRGAAQKKLNKVAVDRATALEPRVSKLTINVVPQDGLQIQLGEEPVADAMWNRAMPVDGGTYTITARAPGWAPWSTQVTVAVEKDHKTLDVPKLEKARASKTPVAMAGKTEQSAGDEGTDDIVEGPQSSPRRSKIVPIVVGVGGLALAGGAVWFELSARASYDDAKAELTDQMRRDSLEDKANTRRYIAQGMAVAGIGCIGVATILLLRGGSSDATTTSLAPVAGANQAGFAIMGSW
jgi:hypothetical protein